MILAGCIGCFTAAPQVRTCEHVAAPWIRLDGYEHVGVCSTCRPMVAIWDAARLTADRVNKALHAALIQDLSEKQVANVTDRINCRIAWFALNQAG
jgi:hypothetical protein